MTFLSKTVSLPSVVSLVAAPLKLPFLMTPFLLCSQTKQQGFPGGSGVKNLPANPGDARSILDPGRSSGEGKSNPLQYSCLGNSWTEEPSRAIVHGVAKSRTNLATEQQQQQAEHGLLWHPCFSKQTWLKSEEWECTINCEWLSWKNKNHFRILSMNGKWHGNVWWVWWGWGEGCWTTKCFLPTRKANRFIHILTLNIFLNISFMLWLNSSIDKSRK